MQLEKGEKSILAYFPSSNQAQNAAEEMCRAGLVPDSASVQVDRISRYGVNNDSEYNSPINNATTLSGPTIYSSSASRATESSPSGIEGGADPLLAASDSASGLGNPDADTAGGSAFMVTLVTSEENVARAVEIIKSNSGRV